MERAFTASVIAHSEKVNATLATLSSANCSEEVMGRGFGMVLKGCQEVDGAGHSADFDGLPEELVELGDELGTDALRKLGKDAASTPRGAVLAAKLAALNADQSAEMEDVAQKVSPQGSDGSPKFPLESARGRDSTVPEFFSNSASGSSHECRELVQLIQSIGTLGADSGAFRDYRVEGITMSTTGNIALISFADIESLARLGALHASDGNWLQALTCFKQCSQKLEHMRKVDSLAQKIQDGFVYLAHLMRDHGELLGSHDALSEAYKLRERMAMPKSVVDITLLMQMGIVQHLRGHIDIALKDYEQALDVCESLGKLQTREAARLYLNIGLAHDSFEQSEEALVAYMEARSVHQRLGMDSLHSPNGILLMTNLGRLQQKNHDFADAFGTLKVARRICIDMGQLETAAGVNLQVKLGNLRLEAGDPHGASQEYMAAVWICERIGSLSSIDGADVCQRFGDAQRLCAKAAEDSKNAKHVSVAKANTRASQAYELAYSILKSNQVERGIELLARLGECRLAKMDITGALAVFTEQHALLKNAGTLESEEGQRLYLNYTATISAAKDGAEMLEACGVKGSLSWPESFEATEQP